MNTSTRNRKGFTLIELLTVIAIIGILAAVLFPGVQGVMRSAKKNSALNKLRNIGQGYINWAGSTRLIGAGPFVKDGVVTDSIGGLACILARDSSLDSGELWFLDGDEAAAGIATYPKQVFNAATGLSNADFKTAFTSGMSGWDFYTPTSKSLVGNVNAPLGWTRGLGKDGKWPIAGATAAGSVWGVEGGHILYGDGHVSWEQVASFIPAVGTTNVTDWSKATGVNQKTTPLLLRQEAP